MFQNINQESFSERWDSVVNIAKEFAGSELFVPLCVCACVSAVLGGSGYFLFLHYNRIGVIEEGTQTDLAL
jgi:hypothetical protein